MYLAYLLLFAAVAEHLLCGHLVSRAADKHIKLLWALTLNNVSQRNNDLMLLLCL